ncbi:MAG: DUF262 domain-containing protein [Treponema sp.]|nr:DUF262 domain-containing protein [Treponema sp.]
MTTGDYINTTVSDVIRNFVNKNTFLPAIQREYVWGTYEICKLFDSLMCGYPISSFLFWKIREEDKNKWSAYEFIRDFDKESPHNKEANFDGLNKDLYFVLDGQQRMTSLYIGLKGSFSYFYYRKRKEYLAIDLLKEPSKEINPDELQYGFKFIEESEFENQEHCWYRVGDILNYDKAREAKQAIAEKTSKFSSQEQDIIENNLEDLHTMVHTARCINYYDEKTDDYDKVVEIFVRTNTGGVKLEYSDILLSTATAKWKKLNAREEIFNFTDEINKIGSGYKFGKDFVMKGAMYLTDGLPIQYKVSSFTKENLEKIEFNWEKIKESLSQTILLLSSFGFNDKNIVSKNAVLPISFYIQNKNVTNFVNSSDKELIEIKNNIQKWFVLNTIRNSFGSSSDTTLKQCQEILELYKDKEFPYLKLNEKLSVSPKLNESEINNYLQCNYGTKYSYLLLSLLYPNRDWLDKKYAEDHIFPKTEFTRPKLIKRGYSEEKIQKYLEYYNTILNLELLEETENKAKNAISFDEWISSRDENFKKRHSIPEISDYSFDNFLEFIEERKKMLVSRYSEFNFS